MKNNKDRNELFIEACDKAGLKVKPQAEKHVADGLIVYDDRGWKYIVDSMARLQPDDSFRDASLKRVEVDSMARLQPDDSFRDASLKRVEKVVVGKAQICKVRRQAANGLKVYDNRGWKYIVDSMARLQPDNSLGCVLSKQAEKAFKEVVQISKVEGSVSIRDIIKQKTNRHSHNTKSAKKIGG